jgi:DNA-binding beta-propeller fold protein YncE
MSKLLLYLLAAALLSPARAELKTGPALPYHPVQDWAKLPKGWTLGECSGVAVDKNDNVWIFNRGSHPVIQLDKNGNMLQSWGEGTVVSSHGIRIDPQGNVWTIDVKGHRILKHDPTGKVLMVLGRSPGTNETKEDYNEPTNVAFAPNRDFFITDGYVNSRVVKYTAEGDYIKQWGKKGTGDGEFNLVHDVVLDSAGRVYIGDRLNQRVQIFDMEGKFLGKWTDLGAPWGLNYVDREKAIYMCDGVNDRVIKVNLEGQVLGVLGSHGKTPGKFDYPHAIAVDSSGAIYVAEIKNWRVQKFVK